MFRYHYKGETPGYKISTSSTSVLVNEDITFSVKDIIASIGGTPQLTWNFGDGISAVHSGTSITHAYSRAGTYVVKLTATNPEYGTVTRSTTVNIYNPLSVSLCINGPTYLDLCGVDPPQTSTCGGGGGGGIESIVQPMVALPTGHPTQLTVVVSGGCPGYTYSWEYYTNGYWASLGTGASISFDRSSAVGSYQIRCTVTDGCFNSSSSSTYISYYESSTGCVHN